MGRAGELGPTESEAEQQGSDLEDGEFLLKQLLHLTAASDDANGLQHLPLTCRDTQPSVRTHNNTPV